MLERAEIELLDAARLLQLNGLKDEAEATERIATGIALTLETNNSDI
jgi:hypothetical protein